MGRGCSKASSLCPRCPAFRVLPHTLRPSSAVDPGPPSINSGVTAVTDLGLLAWKSNCRGRKRLTFLLKPGDSLNDMVAESWVLRIMLCQRKLLVQNCAPPILPDGETEAKEGGTFSQCFCCPSLRQTLVCGHFEPPDPQVPTAPRPGS